VCALPRPRRRRLSRPALIAGALLIAASVTGVAVLLGVFASETVKRVQLEQQANAVDTNFAPNVSDDVRKLVARHTPVLAMANADYDPIEARIYLNEPPSVRIAGRCITELTPRPAGLPADACITAATLPRTVERRTRLDITGLDAANEVGYKDLYDRLAPDFQRVTYVDVQTQPGTVIVNYWLFYFFNFNPADIGNHEGDWERVQVRINANSVADALSYEPSRNPERFALAISRHRCDSTGSMPARPWLAIESDDTHPVVFVGYGSHANYFEAGFKRPGHDGVQCTVIDNAPGERRLKLQPVMIDCAAAAPSWLAFGGGWGAGGPDGPCQHEARDVRLPLR
jgi:hypothetical protein